MSNNEFMSVKDAEKYAEMDMGLTETGFIQSKKVQIPDALLNRWNTGCESFDDVFGALVPGSTFTFCGVRGTGKTTFITQLMQRIHEYHDGDKLCGFTSGEEPIGQLRLNLKRIGADDIMVANMTYVEDICEAMDEFDFLVIDSFQSLRSRLGIGPRKLARYAQNVLIARAKETMCTIGFIMHCNKAGVIKGDTSLPHAVDLEMSIENRGHNVRAIVVDKNRFGNIGDIGFKMTDTGLDLDEPIDLDENEETDGEGAGGDRARRKREDMDAIAKYIRDQGEVSHTDLFRSLNLSATRITALLKEFQDKGQVEKEGTRKHNMVYRWVDEIAA